MGFRAKLDKLFPKGFHSTDEEIIEDLQHKVLDETDECVIPHVDAHEQDEAWELASMINEMWEGELKEWCFIRSLKGKYKNGKRQCRTTRSGYWKVTGKERKIRNEDTNKIIGTKKTLVFHTGRVPNGKRTNWVMHEYHLSPKYLAKHNKQDQMFYVGCRLRMKKDKKGAGGGCGASQSDDQVVEDDHSISISNESSDFGMESRAVAGDDRISLSDNNLDNVTEGSVVVVEDGSQSSCNIVASGTEIVEIPGNREMQIENYLGLEEQHFPLDFNYSDSFSPSEFFSDLEMEHGGEDEWKTFLNWEELNDPEDGTDKSLPQGSFFAPVLKKRATK